MADVPQVTITAGVPTAGDGTVQTLSTTNAVIGAVIETAPATDTASSGLNGRLQRVAQRISSLIALIPTALGANGGFKVDGVASGTAVPVSVATLPSHAVTNAGTFAVQAAAVVTALQDGSQHIIVDSAVGLADSVAFVAQTGSAVMGFAETTPTAVTAVDLAFLSLDPTTRGLRSMGDVAHDAADGGSPIKLGAKATAALSTITKVAAADRTNVFAGVDGVLINRPHTNLEDIVTGNATNTDGTSTSCIAAQSGSIKTYLTSIILCNTSATAITVDIKDGSTVKVSLPLPAGSGCVFNPPVPIPGTAATAWNFDGSAAATTVTCSMIGFKSLV